VVRAEGLSDAEVGRRLGVSKRTVSKYLQREGGIRPRACRRSERCLTVGEREEISRGIACGESARAIGRALGRSHTTVSREINRCGGRRSYRAHAAEQKAWRRARRPRPSKLELCRELREVVIERLRLDHSPQQISGWLRLSYPDNEEMQVSHEAIYRALYVQARGSLARELTAHLRTGRQKRYARTHSNRGQGLGKFPDMVMIAARPPEVEDRAVPGHWEGDLLMGTRDTAIATLVERQTRYCQLVALPQGTNALPVCEALKTSITTLPEQLRRRRAAPVTPPRGSCLSGSTGVGGRWCSRSNLAAGCAGRSVAASRLYRSPRPGARFRAGSVASADPDRGRSAEMRACSARCQTQPIRERSPVFEFAVYAKAPFLWLRLSDSGSHSPVSNVGTAAA
jgi:IS30 family transposase